MGAPNGEGILFPKFDFDTGAGFDYHPAVGLYIPKDGGHELVSDTNPLPTASAQGGDYIASDSGRLYVGANQTPARIPGTAGAFVSTTPQIMLRNNSSSKRVSIRSLSVSMALANAGGEYIHVHVVLDSVDRYSAGGTAVTPKNLNSDVATASALTAFYENPTATAAGGTARFITNFAISKLVASHLILSADSGVIIGTTGSLLLYLRNTSGNVGQWYYNVFWEEID
jgi:hypothetical protein